MDRFKEARDRGCEYLLERQRPDGGFGDPALGVADYYKVPAAFMVCGHSNPAAQLCGWIRKNGMTQDGDFVPRLVETGGYAYTYYNAWVIIGAHRLGQLVGDGARQRDKMAWRVAVVAGHLPPKGSVSRVSKKLGDVVFKVVSPQERHAPLSQCREHPVLGLQRETAADDSAFLTCARAVEADSPLSLHHEHSIIDEADEPHHLVHAHQIVVTELAWPLSGQNAGLSDDLEESDRRIRSCPPGLSGLRH